MSINGAPTGGRIIDIIVLPFWDVEEIQLYDDVFADAVCFDLINDANIFILSLPGFLLPFIHIFTSGRLVPR